MKKVENGLLEVNGDIFIIPNGFGTPEEMITRKEETKEYMTKILAASGASIGNYPHIIMMESWISSEEDLNTENLADHGGSCIDENGNDLHLSGISRYLPAQLFVSDAEGDIVDVTIPKGALKCNESFDIKLHLRLAQTEYRYRRFGNFEKVFCDLMGNFRASHPQRHVAANSCEAIAMEV